MRHVRGGRELPPLAIRRAWDPQVYEPDSAAHIPDETLQLLPGDQLIVECAAGSGSGAGTGGATAGNGMPAPCSAALFYYPRSEPPLELCQTWDAGSSGSVSASPPVAGAGAAAGAGAGAGGQRVLCSSASAAAAAVLGGAGNLSIADAAAASLTAAGLLGPLAHPPPFQPYVPPGCKAPVPWEA